MSGGFYFYLHLYRYLYLYLLKNRLKPHQIMVSGGSLGKDSTLDERSGLDNFVLMLRPGWIRHQTDFVEARVSKTLPAQPSESDPRHSDSNEEIVRHVGMSALGQREKWRDRSDYRRRTIYKALLGCGSSIFCA